MGIADSKSYQLRVRVTPEERDLLEKLRLARNRGETISDLVREGISSLAKPVSDGNPRQLSGKTLDLVNQIALLLKREPRQVEAACIEGILDLIEHKCEVPLIVMETHLHLKYRGKDSKDAFPWQAPEEPEPDSISAVPSNGVRGKAHL